MSACLHLQRASGGVPGSILRRFRAGCTGRARPGIFKCPACRNVTSRAGARGHVIITQPGIDSCRDKRQEVACVAAEPFLDTDVELTYSHRNVYDCNAPISKRPPG